MLEDSRRGRQRTKKCSQKKCTSGWKKCQSFQERGGRKLGGRAANLGLSLSSRADHGANPPHDLLYDAPSSPWNALGARASNLKDSSPPSRPSAELEAGQSSAELWVRQRCPGYGGRAGEGLTNGRPGGKEPTGNFADRSPALSLSAASRKAATNML